MSGPTAVPAVALVHDYFVQDGGAEAVALELARHVPARSDAHDLLREGPIRRPDRPRPGASVVGLPPVATIALVPAAAPGLCRALQQARGSRLATRPEQLIDVRSGRPSTATGHPCRLRPLAPSFRVGRRGVPRRLELSAGGSRGPASRGTDPAPVGPVGRSPCRCHRGELAERCTTGFERRWGRDSAIIHPPVDVAGIEATTSHDGFYLVATRLLAYKRVEVAIEACQRMGRELVVVGDGPERRRLEGLAGRGTRIAGHVDRATLVDLFQRCHALIVPGVEDFGIAPVEAMAYGKPVVAYARGGVLETVIDGQTGVLFDAATSSSLGLAIERLEAIAIDPARCHARARDFDVAVFRGRWAALLDTTRSW